MWTLMVLYGGIVSRLHGMDVLPRWARNLLWSVPFAAVAYFVTDQIWFIPFVLVTCWLGKTTGHGNFFETGDHDDIGGPERIEYLILWLKPYIGTGHLYNAIGMSLAGLAAVAGAALAIGLYNPIDGFVLALCGLLKGPLYDLGRRIEPYLIAWNIPHLKSKTNFGEFTTGLVAYGGVVMCLTYP
jgi:hypothetical protein